MLKLKQEITSKRDTWIISITGRKELPIIHSLVKTITREISNDYWNDAVVLLLSYFQTWRNGEKFKKRPVWKYIGWLVGCNLIDIFWGDIVNVRVRHTIEEGILEDVELLDISKEFPDESKFFEALEKAHQKACSEFSSPNLEPYGRWLEPWELSTVREVLSQQEGWKKEELDNLFYINNDTGFAVIGNDEWRQEMIGKLASSRYQARDKSGKMYTGFKKETLEVIEKTLSTNPELPGHVREFAIDVLRSYSIDSGLKDHQIKYLTTMAGCVDKLKSGVLPSGPKDMCGIYLCELNPDIDIDNLSVSDERVKCLLNLPKDHIIKTGSGKTYFIEEAD